MDAFVSFSYGLVGKWAETERTNAVVQKRLLQANVQLRASAYHAAVYVASGIAALVGLVIAGVLMLPLAQLPLAMRMLLPILAALLFGGAVLALAPILLQNAITERAKEIDENLPHGLNYMLALANAGLPPKEIWGSLARATVFGALAEEAARIQRDLDLFSHDILTALRNAQERTASKTFNEFLQGAISAFQSGVELESYLKTKGAQYQHKAIEHQLEVMDTMGVMAETFLVMVVAAPLFLIILLTVMAVNQGQGVILWGFLLSLIFMPLCQVIIGTLIHSMNPKVWT